jgi:hypothetical protein
MNFGLRQLLPELEAAIEVEPDASVRKSLVGELALLRDGYHLRVCDDTRVDVTFRTPRGGVVSTLITAQELKEKGLQEIARRLGTELPLRR